jgi:hypothetical protein
MRPAQEYEAVHWLIEAGLNDCEIDRSLGIPRGTVRDWRHRGRRGLPPPLQPGRLDPDCPRCGEGDLPQQRYAYLLGMYLGDGCLSEHRGRVFKLRISCCDRYPRIMEECAKAIRAIRARKTMPVFRTRRIGCTELSALWKHWVCLFPQHGPGPKHKRRIQLAHWQERIAKRHPDRLLRGLIHSDGCRSINRVNGYAYSRYQFSNRSIDIQEIFCRACDAYGVRWRQMNRYTISVARRADVAKLDLVVGPKS